MKYPCKISNKTNFYILYYRARWFAVSFLQNLEDTFMWM